MSNPFDMEDILLSVNGLKDTRKAMNDENNEHIIV